MTPEWLWIGALAAVAALDRTALVQAGVGRPLVVGAAVGWILGRPEAGLLAGALLELFWLYDLPVGAAVPPDEAAAGIAAAAGACAFPEEAGPWAAGGYGVLLGLLAGHLAGRVDEAVRRWNNGLAERARARLASGRPVHLGRLVALGALRFGAVGMLAAAGLAGLAAWGGDRVPAPAYRGLELLGVTLPVLGAAACLGRLPAGRGIAWFSAGASVAAGGQRAGLWPR
ncbi:PTS sugar transporter subunit IIC [Deferrisoma sp.]